MYFAGINTEDRSFVFLVCVVPRHAVLFFTCVRYLTVLCSFLFITLGVWKGNEDGDWGFDHYLCA